MRSRFFYIPLGTVSGAEEEGFQPPHRFSESTVFKTVAVTLILSAYSSIAVGERFGLPQPFSCTV